MSTVMKRSLSFVLLLAIALVMAVPAFASTYTHDYQFNYDGEYHEHSSSYIAGPAVIDDTANTVTIQLNGNYFPEIKIGTTSYSGSYNSTTGLTTFVLPGTDASNFDTSLHVRVTILGIPVHDTWYDLELVWLP